MNALADHPHLAERTAIDGAVLLPVHLVRPNPWNRKINEARLAEMAASVAKHGVLQPIIARELLAAPAGQAQYEIIAGERRWRASQLAGIDLVPALLRQMTDLEVIELMLIENLQREDLHPLDEADGYHRLLRREDGLQGFASVDDLAARFGKSKSYVHQRLKLRELQDEQARASFLEGEITASVALLIARLAPADQATATRRILQGWGGHPLPFREAAEYIHQEFMLSLDKAVFKITDATLVPEAGSCLDCPKRSGANPDLFEDVKKGDTCTDAACYHRKEDAHRAQLKATAEAEGKPVITGAEAKKAKPQSYGGIKGYLELDQVHYEIGDKPLRKLLGKHVPEIIAFEDPHTKLLIDVVRRDDALAVLKERGVLKQSKMPTTDARARETDRKNKAETAWRAAVAEACITAAGSSSGAEPAYRSSLLTRLAQQLWHEMHADTTKRITKLLAWPPLRSGWQSGPGITAADHITGLSDTQLCQFFTAAVIAGEIHIASYQNSSAKPERLQGVAQALGVDTAAIREEQRKLARVVPDKAAAGRARKKAADMTEGSTPETALAAALDKAKAAPAKTARLGARPAVKYRDAATGSTWSGRGLQPKWLKVALAAGAALDDYLVGGPVPTPKPAPKPAPAATAISAVAADPFRKLD